MRGRSHLLLVLFALVFAPSGCKTYLSEAEMAPPARTRWVLVNVTNRDRCAEACERVAARGEVAKCQSLYLEAPPAEQPRAVCELRRP